MIKSDPIQHCPLSEISIYIEAHVQGNGYPTTFDDLIHAVQGDALAAGYFPPTVSQVSEQILALESSKTLVRHYIHRSSAWWASHHVADADFRDVLAVLRDVAGVSQEFAGVDLRGLIARLEVAG